MKIAYICEPQVGGTYTFFKNLRLPLKSRGIDFQCVAPIKKDCHNNSIYAEDDGVYVLDVTPDDPMFCVAMKLFLETNNYDGVMILANVYPMLSVLQQLDRRIFRVVRLPHNAKGVYEPAVRLAPVASRYVAVSDRLRDDLVSGYGVDGTSVDVIYHGVDIDLFCPKKESSFRSCELLYVGRLEDSQKHVSILPQILYVLRKRYNCVAKLTIAGHGPDRGLIEKKAKKYGVDGQIRFLGAVLHSELPAVYNDHKILLLPSRFEGCGFTLLEAMGCGCVPVVSNIKGIFDQIVTHDQSGYLCRVGDCTAFANEVGHLLENAAKLEAMSHATRVQIVQRFSIDRMVGQYAQLFDDLSQAENCGGVSLDNARSNACVSSVCRCIGRALPKNIKNVIRTWAERLGYSA